MWRIEGLEMMAWYGPNLDRFPHYTLPCCHNLFMVGTICEPSRNVVEIWRAEALTGTKQSKSRPRPFVQKWVVRRKKSRIYLKLGLHQLTDLRASTPTVKVDNMIEQCTAQWYMIHWTGRINHKGTFDFNSFVKEVSRSLKGDYTTERPTFDNKSQDGNFFEARYEPPRRTGPEVVLNTYLAYAMAIEVRLSQEFPTSS
jgi:hypothetical protein